MQGNLKPHQARAVTEAREILENSGVVLVAGQPRTGKTRVALSLMSGPTLLVTKKAAISGILKEVEAMGMEDNNLTITNYESLHKVEKQEWQTVIVDESHRIGAFPKPGKGLKELYKHSKWCPRVILLTGTPSAESYSSLFHQFAASMHSPWREYRNFYQWHNVYGVPKTAYRAGGNLVKVYDEVKTEKVLGDIEPFLVIMSQEEAGFSHSVTVAVHNLATPEVVARMDQELQKDSMTNYETIEIVAESAVAVLQKRHQIAGGAVKVGETEYLTVDKYKADYIRKSWPDTQLAVLTHYKGEEIIHKKVLGGTDDLKLWQSGETKVFVGNISRFCEGVDLSAAKLLVIPTLPWSYTRYSQSLERINNMSRGSSSPPVVHLLFGQGTLDQDVYDALMMKEPFTLDYYRSRGSS